MDMTMTANSETVATAKDFRRLRRDIECGSLPNVTKRTIGSQAILDWGNWGIEDVKKASGSYGIANSWPL